MKPEKIVQITAFVLLICVFAIIYLMHPDFFIEICHATTCGDIDKLVTYINSFGVWAIVISFVIDVLINAAGCLPSIFMSTANGIMFGVVGGVIVSWLAETTGVIISFLLMRTVLRDTAEKIIRKSKYLTKLDEFSGKDGFKLMLIARTIPYFPSGILTALGAVSRISVKDYALSNLIGKFPSTALEVIIGHDVVLLEENMVRLTLVVIGATVVYGALWYYQKKKTKREKDAEKDTESAC